MRAILQGCILIGVVSFLFYERFWVSFLLSPYLIWYLKSWEKQMVRKKQREFQSQFKEGILAMSSALNVGYSVENAMREAWKDLQLLYTKEERIVREFGYMVHQLDMKLSVERILQEFAQRTQDEDVETFVTVFSMAKRSGGDVVEIIRDAVYQIGEKIDVMKEINTMMAAKKMEFYIMSVIPFAMIGYLKISFSSFMQVLYGNLMGTAIMTVCLVIYVVAFEVGKRIVEIEV